MLFTLFTFHLNFAGGLIVAIFTLSIWPEVLDRLTACPPAKTVTLAALVYIVNVLFEVWTVAYNFVPGGEYTREHTGYQIGFVSLILGLTLHHSKCCHLEALFPLALWVAAHVARWEADGWLILF